MPQRKRDSLRRVRLAAEAIRVLGVAALVEVGLRIARLPRVARWCGIRLELTSAPTVSPTVLLLPPATRRQLRAVDVVMSRWPFGDTCLRRCLVLGHRLRRFQPALRIGVANDDHRGFRAHSWLEIGGRALDSDVAEFSAFGSA